MLRRLSDIVFLRYIAASAFALGLDLGSFLAMLAFGVTAAAAAAVGYSLGIVAHWLVSSRAVFSTGVAERGPERTRQKALFVMSALLGLGLTTAIVGLGGSAGLDPRLAKLIAIAASFTLTWLMREKIIFRTRAAA
jgi:putative flippase GtrA